MTDDPRPSLGAGLTLLLTVSLAAACATPATPTGTTRSSVPAATDVNGAPAAGEVDAGASRSLSAAPSPTASKKATAGTVASCGAFAAGVRSAVTHARAVAEGTGRELPAAAAAMFSDLADAIAAQPQSSQTRQKVLKELRFQAERLRRADRINFGLARWMKEGLLAALDGLQVIAPGDTRAPFWIGAARETVSGIEKDSGVAFQRARIQDAVRSTVDAFAAVGRIDETCP